MPCATSVSRLRLIERSTTRAKSSIWVRDHVGAIRPSAALASAKMPTGWIATPPQAPLLLLLRAGRLERVLLRRALLLGVGRLWLLAAALAAHRLHQAVEAELRRRRRGAAVAEAQLRLLLLDLDLIAHRAHGRRLLDRSLALRVRAGLILLPRGHEPELEVDDARMDAREVLLHQDGEGLVVVALLPFVDHVLRHRDLQAFLRQAAAGRFLQVVGRDLPHGARL